MNLGLVFSEVFNGLRRNLSMVISIVLVTFVSLTFVGTAILIQMQISTMRDFWVEHAKVGVYMCSTLSMTDTCVDGPSTAAQTAQVRAELESPTLAPLISSFTFDTREETYRKMLEVVGEDYADILTVDQMNEIFWLVLTDPSDVKVIDEAFRGVAGVEEVRDEMRYLDPLFSALTVASYVAVAIAGLMLIAAALLIGTTIRLSAHARRREIRIMRLVGASNRSIQTPFVLEGVFSAFVGSLFAGVAIVLGVHFGVNQFLADRVGFIATWVGMPEALIVVPIVIGVGIVLAAFSASFAIRRWLRA